MWRCLAYARLGKVGKARVVACFIDLRTLTWCFALMAG